MINSIKGFWMDYYAYYYNRLKKNSSEKDPEFDILLGILTTVFFNISALLIVFFKLFDFNLVEREYMLIIAFLTVVISLFFWFKTERSWRDKIKNRIPRYDWYVYQGYSLFSFLLLLLIVYLVSPNT